jgi:isopentenyl-diphosphate delta-isomerase type 2
MVTVNTNSIPPEIETPSEIEERKAKHLSICSDPSRYTVETPAIGFEGIHLVHDALPEMADGEIDTSVDFLGRRVALPFFISCMTGGSEGGFQANRDLARAAQQLGIPVGIGSVRVLFDHPELFPHFHIKPLAPDVPVMANLAAQQIRDYPHRRIMDLIGRLEAEALVIHVNPGQELFQPEGDRDFRGLKEAIASFCRDAQVPVIVKETGFGIHLGLIRELMDMGVAYVDLAGAGGTNWITVEAYRLPGEDRSAAREFEGWGLPTALLLASIPKDMGSGKILASGGLRSGMDLAKALVLGAELGGMALPLIRKVKEGGVAGVVEFTRSLEQVLRAVMLLTGSRTVADLRGRPCWTEGWFSRAAESFRRTSGG